MATAPPVSETCDLREKRGSDTRHALILAGLELFGEYGTKGTTTRMLCEASGANVAAINYHFVNKEGLYLAVVEHISNCMQQHMRPTAEAAVAAAQTDGFTPKAARAAMTTIIDMLARLMVESDEVRIWARIIVREQANPTAAFDRLYDNGMARMQATLARLVGAATGLDPESAETKIRVHAMIGQVLNFAVSRESLHRVLRVKKLTRDHIATIRTVLHAHVDACLRVPPLSS